MRTGDGDGAAVNPLQVMRAKGRAVVYVTAIVRSGDGDGAEGSRISGNEGEGRAVSTLADKIGDGDGARVRIRGREGEGAAVTPTLTLPSVGDQTTREGVAFTFTLPVASCDRRNPPLVYSLTGTLPAGITFHGLYARSGGDADCARIIPSDLYGRG